MSKLRTIVCPVDFSAASEDAARYAVDLAEKIGADKLDFIHVFQRPVHAIPELGYYVEASAAEQIKESLRRQLDTLARRYSAHAVEVETHLLEGVPFSGIVEHADASGADMIVMATHGRTGFTRFLLGSVAEKVVRTSSIPVCTVRVGED